MPSPRAVLDSSSDPASPRQTEVTLTRNISQSEWDRYVERHPHGTVDHLWDWRNVIASVFNHTSEYIAAHRGGTLTGVLPLVLFRSALFGRFVVSMPFLNDGGLLADDRETADALLADAGRAATEFDASHIELRHRCRQFPALPFRQHKLGLVRSLPSSPRELWDGLDRKVRNQVRKAQKEGLSASVGGAELIDDFYAVFSRNMRDLGTPVYSRRLFQETLRHFPLRARVFVVRHAGHPVAGAVALRCRETVLVPWASSLRDYRHLCPNMLLYWTMLESAIDDGATRFDFGRSSPDGGTHQFKLQWGATAEPLHWEYLMLDGSRPPDQGPGNPLFTRAVNMWTRLPLSMTNLLGPHVVRHIP
jgi:serine/alanine adding enzyme